MIDENDDVANVYKLYVVTGANWSADVSIDNDFINNTPKDSIVVEVATRAVEALFKKRKDIEIHTFDKSVFNYDENGDTITVDKNDMRTVIVDLLTDELVPNCGIGMLICIACEDDLTNESYISSKIVLQNAGINNGLIEAFDVKYPDDDSDLPMVKTVKKPKKKK